MPLLLLKLLGIGNSIKNFIFKHWKIVLPVLLVIAAYFYISHLISSAYKDGVEAENARWIEKVDAEDEKNREFEIRLGKAISTYGEKVIKESETRVLKEKTHTETLKTIVTNNPIYQDCKVEDAVLENKNSIRQLGPKP